MLFTSIVIFVFTIAIGASCLARKVRRPQIVQPVSDDTVLNLGPYRTPAPQIEPHKEGDEAEPASAGSASGGMTLSSSWHGGSGSSWHSQSSSAPGWGWGGSSCGFGSSDSSCGFGQRFLAHLLHFGSSDSWEADQRRRHEEEEARRRRDDEEFRRRCEERSRRNKEEFRRQCEERRQRGDGEFQRRREEWRQREEASA